MRALPTTGALRSRRDTFDPASLIHLCPLF
jgi:hypothetical protein